MIAINRSFPGLFPGLDGEGYVVRGRRLTLR
jgi:hypothetical protein